MVIISILRLDSSPDKEGRKTLTAQRLHSKLELNSNVERAEGASKLKYFNLVVEGIRFKLQYERRRRRGRAVAARGV